MGRVLFFLTIYFMEITLEKTSDCRTELRAVVAADDIQEMKKSVISSYCRNVRLAGFRPGKVPASVVERHFAKEVKEQVHGDICSDVQSELLKENPDMKVLDFGAMSVSEEEDGSCVVTSSLTIVPSFELPEYFGLEVTVPSTEVSDAEVEDTMRRYAESAAKYERTDRAAAMGDMVVMDFKTTVEGKPTAEFLGRAAGFMDGREDYHFALGEDGFLPGLGEGLVGAQAGDTREVNCTMRENFPITELAGKEVCFSCSIKEVQEKQVPEITAELFATIFPDKSLDEVRDEVRKHLKENKERNNDELKADQISEKLADQLTFALPEDLVERENDNTVQRKIYAAIQSGNYDVAKDMDALREESKPETERNLRVYFALLEIAERENVVATDQEVMESISRMAAQAREKNLKAFVRKLQSENRITGIRLSIVTTKVIDLMVRRANVVVKDETPAEESAAEQA